jgi:hypothetical protein
VFGKLGVFTVAFAQKSCCVLYQGTYLADNAVLLDKIHKQSDGSAA